MKIFFLLFFSSLTFAADPVCVRNYAKQGAGNLCKTNTESYASLQHFENAETEVCTRIYADFYCETAPQEYVKVVTLDKRTICTLNYNRPPIVNLCQGASQFYDYVAKTP